MILVTHELDIAARARRRITFRDGLIVEDAASEPARRLQGRASQRSGSMRCRSFLAMLGVIIGVASVIVMVSVASGAGQAIEARIKALGTNLLGHPARLLHLGRTARRRRHRARAFRDPTLP